MEGGSAARTFFYDNWDHNVDLVFGLLSAGYPEWGSKCQNHEIARGPPKPAEGQARVEDQGECFAPCSDDVATMQPRCSNDVASMGGTLGRKQ